MCRISGTDGIAESRERSFESVYQPDRVGRIKTLNLPSFHLAIPILSMKKERNRSIFDSNTIFLVFNNGWKLVCECEYLKNHLTFHYQDFVQFHDFVRFRWLVSLERRTTRGTYDAISYLSNLISWLVEFISLSAKRQWCNICRWWNVQCEERRKTCDSTRARCD